MIDVFYKLKGLHALGIQIYLHTFEYGRGNPRELSAYCKEVFYYNRDSSMLAIISKTPYIVGSRSSKDLILNLKKIKAPILFEGLHTTFPLTVEDFSDRKVVIRAHNIEHLYYEGLSNSERRIDKKVFFKWQVNKLKRYQKILNKADKILTISPSEHAYFSEKFDHKAEYIPVFHQNTTIKQLSGKGEGALYHGDLRVADNKRSVHYLMEIFKKLDCPLVIASSFNNRSILKEIAKFKHISFIQIKDQEHLLQLMEKAHINVLPTFQKTGIKLKLINTLYNGRFCVVTPEMVEDTGLEDLCEVANTKKDFSEKVKDKIDQEFSIQAVKQRASALLQFDTKKSAQKIIDLIY